MPGSFSRPDLVEKSPPGGSHCGDVETSRLRDPPQAEESRKRDSIYTGKMRSILSRTRPDLVEHKTSVMWNNG